MKCNSKCLETIKITKVLVIIGALNWGLVGIGGFLELNWNVVNFIFGNFSYLENIIYILVGLSAVLMLKKCGGKCQKKEGTCSSEPIGNTKMDINFSNEDEMSI